MNRRARIGRTALVLVGALALGPALSGCAKGHTAQTSQSSGGAGLPTYNASVQKFKYSGFPDTIKTGNMLVDFSNRETYPMTHELVVVAVPAGKTAQDIIAAAKKTGDASEDQWLHFGEIADVNTGATKVGVFNLPPGTYAMACWQTGTPQGKPKGGPVHLTVGMIHQFTVS